MRGYHNSLRRDPIQRDPIYDALDVLNREKLRVETYGSGLFWGSIVGLLIVAGILLITYDGNNSHMVGSSNLPMGPKFQVLQPG